MAFSQFHNSTTSCTVNGVIIDFYILYESCLLLCYFSSIIINYNAEMFVPNLFPFLSILYFYSAHCTFMSPCSFIYPSVYLYFYLPCQRWMLYFHTLRFKKKIYEHIKIDYITILPSPQESCQNSLKEIMQNPSLYLSQMFC